MRDTGTIKSFDSSKGFGFITSAGGENVFFHKNSISGGSHDELRPGENVKFDKEESPKGLRANNVAKVL